MKLHFDLFKIKFDTKYINKSTDMRRRAIAVGHRYFSRIGWVTAVHVAVNGHCLQSSSIQATYTFEFLSEHVQLTKQPAVEKVTDQGPVSRPENFSGPKSYL